MTETERVDNFIEMFASPGWKQVIDDANKLMDVLEEQAAYQAVGVEQLYYTRGRLMQLRQLVSLETAIRASGEADNVHIV
jgi:hypothetical protein